MVKITSTWQASCARYNAKQTSFLYSNNKRLPIYGEPEIVSEFHKAILKPSIACLGVFGEKLKPLQAML
jgi:hypothetical protein